jgi:2-phosphosulfolactate phosphatase
MSVAPVEGRRLIQATSNGTRGLVRHPDAAALLAVSARNVGATARWIAENHAGVGRTLVCTGRTAEDWACARYLSGLLGGAARRAAGEPSRSELVAGIMAGAAEQRRRSALLPEPERVDLSEDLPFCCDVDRSGFAMVGEIRGGHVVLTRVPC